ncbi:MAG: hypothetical protein LBS73_00950 [Campylobacteraceae bacterium]|jgi:hypothetical protein|nr:hypothetical protein [Campylobacteraceae bacterium]
MKIIVLILTGIFFTGCYYYDDDDDMPQRLDYSGNIYDCSFRGKDCVDSRYCVVTSASGSIGDVKCYKSRHKEGYDYLSFYGTLSSCYFNGNQCLYSHYCEQKNSNRIECSR